MNHFPRIHNAMWPGLVGKGPDAEPPIDLDTMLNLTAAAEVDGARFDGVDLFLSDPHVSIDATDDELKQLADRISASESGGRLGRRAGLAADGRRLGDGQRERAQRSSSTQVRKACRIATKLRELGIRPYGVVRIDSAASVGRVGEGSGRQYEADRRDVSQGLRHRRTITANGSPPRARSAGAACTAGSSMVELLEMVDRPKTLGFQADMAHTLLFTLGYNAPEDRILPEDFDWSDRRRLDAGAARS